MANPDSPVSGDSNRMGYFVEKVGSTLTAAFGRVIAKATTSGATPVGHLTVATHVDDDTAAYSDAGSVTPMVMMGGKGGSHGTAYAAGDAMVFQGSRATGALHAEPTPLSLGTVTVVSITASAGTVMATGSALANRRECSIQPVGGTIYYGFDSGVGTATRSTMLGPGERERLALGTAVSVYAIAAAGTVSVRFGEYR